MRSETQKAADRRYSKKVTNNFRTLSFRMKKEECAKIEEVIAASGKSKVDFLRWAVEEWKRGNES